MYHETLVEEAAALHDLGFESFDAFEAVHGADASASRRAESRARPRRPTTNRKPRARRSDASACCWASSASNPVSIPSQAAKQFLDVVEGPDAAAANDAAAPAPPMPSTAAASLASEQPTAQAAVNEFMPPPPPPVVPLTIDIPTPSDTIIPGAKANTPPVPPVSITPATPPAPPVPFPDPR